MGTAIIEKRARIRAFFEDGGREVVDIRIKGGVADVLLAPNALGPVAIEIGAC